MQNEIEATYIDADHDLLRSKLTELGAVLTQHLYTMRRTLFDYEDFRLDRKKSWIRVRQEADKATLSFKQRSSVEINGMKEIEIEVSDYEKCRQIFLEAGLTEKAVQDSKRETWQLGECEVMLDEWPWIPPFAEVEGPTEEAVRATSAKLGLEWNKAVFDSIDGLYLEHFNVTRTEISKAKIFFGPVPEWLEKKRKS